MATKKSPAVKNAKKAKATASVSKPTRVAAKKKTAQPQVAKAVQKKAAAPKKAAPTKAKASPAKAAAKKTPVKKAQAKPVVKKAVAKKAAPAGKKTVVTAKKVAGKKTPMTKKSATPVNKKAAVPKKVAAKEKATTAVAKKAVAAKKAVTKKAAPAAKAAVKKAAAPVETKKAATKKVAGKPAAKTVAKKASAKKTAVVPKPGAAARTVAKTGLPLMPKAKPAVAKPAPVVPRTEKKPAVVIAHRRLENKSKKTEEAGKTMINYQPEFTRSILDEPMRSGPVYRYSDEELGEFKELIQGRLESARKELVYLQGLITRKDEAGTEDTENRYMNMEDGSGAMEREQLAQLASRQIQFINHLEKALIRIENKTYGICRVTGKLIDKARLRAVPHATLSIEAKRTMNK